MAVVGGDMAPSQHSDRLPPCTAPQAPRSPEAQLHVCDVLLGALCGVSQDEDVAKTGCRILNDRSWLRVVSLLLQTAGPVDGESERPEASWRLTGVSGVSGCVCLEWLSPRGLRLWASFCFNSCHSAKLPSRRWQGQWLTGVYASHTKHKEAEAGTQPGAPLGTWHLGHTPRTTHTTHTVQGRQ